MPSPNMIIQATVATLLLVLVSDLTSSTVGLLAGCGLSWCPKEALMADWLLE